MSSAAGVPCGMEGHTVGHERFREIIRSARNNTPYGACGLRVAWEMLTTGPERTPSPGRAYTPHRVDAVSLHSLKSLR